jgi:hypothetical protein
VILLILAYWNDRFFAAAEIKAMMARILINYDVKPQIQGVRLSYFTFGLFLLPNPKGKI